MAASERRPPLAIGQLSTAALLVGGAVAYALFFYRDLLFEQRGLRKSHSGGTAGRVASESSFSCLGPGIRPSSMW